MANKRNSGIGPLLLLGIGAGLMYLFDPQQGSQRRALLRDKAASLRQDAERLWENHSEDILNRAHGLVAEATRIAQELGIPGDSGAGGKTESAS